MLKSKLVSVVILGGTLWVLSPAQVLFSFENDLQDFTSTGATLSQSTFGATHGNFSMEVSWNGGFTWLNRGTAPGIAGVLANNRVLLADVTLLSNTGLNWSNFIVSFNDPAGWRQTNYGPFYLPRLAGTRTVLMDLRPLAAPDPNAPWFQLNIGVNAPAARNFYLDNIRPLDESRTVQLFDFESDLHGFTPQDADIQLSQSTDWASTGSSSMRVEWVNGFNWAFNGGNSAAVANTLNQGKLLIMDVYVPPDSQQGSWWNMILSFNDPGGWRQENDAMGFPTQPGVYTVAIDYRSVAPTDYSQGWFYINLGFNSASGPAILYIDNVRVLLDTVPGDVNGDGCVDDADLLAVLFAFGGTGSELPEDLNGDSVVDDADLLIVLFNFGTGC
ncbi:MAG: hypothetical protein SNJ72_09760 [Fimbriimonadales bacterium]